MLVLLAACSPQKVYQEPEIGMDYYSFTRVCGWSVYDGSSDTETNADGSTTTYILKERTATFYDGGNAANKERIYECVGKFTFTNGKLKSMSR